MKAVHDDDADADALGESGHEDALWLQHVEAEMLPPVEVLLKRVLTDVIQDQTRAIGLQLSQHLLGEWGLLAELRRVRAVLLLGSPAMAAWSDHLCSRLNQGISLSDAASAKLPLFDLHVRLHDLLESALPSDPSLPRPETLSLRHRQPLAGDEGARLGLAMAHSASAQQSLLSQIAHVDVEYEVTWPLSVVLTPADLLRYRNCLPVLLQLHWVRHNLALASKAVWATRQRHADAFACILPKPDAAPGAPPPLTTPRVADALLHMHHTVSTLQRCFLDGVLTTAWTELESALLQQDAAADLDDICALHRAYLARIEWFCILGDDGTSKTLAHALHQMLEIALQFTQAVLFILKPAAQLGRQAVRTQTEAEARIERSNQRAAAARAAKLAAKFKQEVAHLAAVLKNQQLKIVAGHKASHFHELLNFNGFYDAPVHAD